MFGFTSTDKEARRILSQLRDVEMFCLGRKKMSPDEFTDINRELSMHVIRHVGACRYQRHEDGNHVIWIAPDASQHDLGVVEHVDVMRDYPGFHRGRSLCLGQDKVENNQTLQVGRKHINMVRLVDGTEGYGPNYRLALRNAMLKMYLRHDFQRANPLNLWKKFYGNS